MTDLINAAPKVLNVEQLPTREGKEDRAESTYLPDLLSLSVFDLPLAEKSSPGSTPSLSHSSLETDDEEHESVDALEIYDLISSISDPEHPLTLGQLAVVNLQDIQLNDSGNPDEIAEVLIKITPTITHCSLATLIGLGIRVRLERCLPPRYRIIIKVKEKSHQSENQVNKQLNDKERVSAACENDQLLKVISQMLSSCK